MITNDLTARATEKVDDMIGFYVHAGIYAIVCFSLFLVNFIADDVWWVQWVALGWGVGVAAHAAMVFAAGPGYFARWRQRKIYEARERLGNQA